MNTHTSASAIEFTLQDGSTIALDWNTVTKRAAQAAAKYARKNARLDAEDIAAEVAATLWQRFTKKCGITPGSTQTQVDAYVGTAIDGIALEVVTEVNSCLAMTRAEAREVRDALKARSEHETIAAAAASLSITETEFSRRIAAASTVGSDVLDIAVDEGLGATHDEDDEQAFPLTEEEVEFLQALFVDEATTIKAYAETLGVSRKTIERRRAELVARLGEYAVTQGYNPHPVYPARTSTKTEALSA